MPRGSRPGERRGGRQRGTPNKKTLLKNAVFLAAASDPNRSPLDFMLALMRDPQVPLDDRIGMAAAAAPYVHARPQAASRVRTNPMDSSPLKSVPHRAAQRQEDEAGGLELAAEEASDGDGRNLTPLKFLVGVMSDPEASAKQRIRAARIAARYRHAHLQPDKLAPLDEYGFSISRTLAKTIAGDWLALEQYESGRLGAHSADYVKKASEIYARQAERDQVLQCPQDYSPENDLKRRSELHAMMRSGAASMAERTEFAFVVARITAFEAAYNRTPEGRARLRVKELRARIWMRSAGRAKPLPGLTPEEDKELERLHCEFPSLGRYAPYMVIDEEVVRIFRLAKRCLEKRLTPAEKDELEELARQNPERVASISRMVKQPTAEK